MPDALNVDAGSLRFVPLVARHIPALLSWLNALPDNDVWTERAVRFRTTDHPDYDPLLMFAVEQDDESIGILVATTANETGWIPLFLVRPDRQRCGIGTAMFERVERLLADRGITEISVGWALPRYFLPGIQVAFTSALVFLDRRGYETNREARVNMEVVLEGRSFDTTEAEMRLSQEGFTVRRGTHPDLPSITRLCEAHNSLGWATETRWGLEQEPTTVFVAERDGEVRAFAVHSVCGPVHFGPMLTASELRGLGIGSVLLKRCLQDYQEAGLGRCEIAWAGPLSFYARSVDARVNKVFWTFHKSLHSGKSSESGPTLLPHPPEHRGCP